MIIEQVFFYLFAGVGLLSGLMVIMSRNAVHSVLYLVLVFCNAAGMLILLEVDFLAMIFIVVYVGAIAVLFLFVVMMLAPKIEVYRSSRFVVLGWGLGLLYIVVEARQGGKIAGPKEEVFFEVWDRMTGIESLGQILYTYYFYYFILAGFVLLVAMIGAIVLTLSSKTQDMVRKQQVYEQLARAAENAVALYSSEKKR